MDADDFIDNIFPTVCNLIPWVKKNDDLGVAWSRVFSRVDSGRAKELFMDFWNSGVWPRGQPVPAQFREWCAEAQPEKIKNPIPLGVCQPGDQVKLVRRDCGDVRFGWCIRQKTSGWEMIRFWWPVPLKHRDKILIGLGSNIFALGGIGFSGLPLWDVTVIGKAPNLFKARGRSGWPHGLRKLYTDNGITDENAIIGHEFLLSKNGSRITGLKSPSGEIGHYANPEDDRAIIVDRLGRIIGCREPLFGDIPF